LISAVISPTLPLHERIFHPVCASAGDDRSADEAQWRQGNRGRKSVVETAAAGRLPRSAARPSFIGAGPISVRLVVAVPQRAAESPGRYPPEAFYPATIALAPPGPISRVRVTIRCTKSTIKSLMTDSVREMGTKIKFFQVPEFSSKVRIRHAYGALISDFVGVLGMKWNLAGLRLARQDDESIISRRMQDAVNEMTHLRRHPTRMVTLLRQECIGFLSLIMELVL